MAQPSAHVLFQLPLLSMSSEPLSRFPVRSRFLALPLTVDSHLMHISLHFQNTVSITSVHSATSIPTSHWTAPRTLPVLSSAVASITPTRPSWNLDSEHFSASTFAKHARSRCHMSTGTHQYLQDFAGASLASYPVAYRL